MTKQIEKRALQTDYSPGFTGKKQFAWERYNTDWQTLRRRILKEPNMVQALKNIGLDVKRGRDKILNAKQKELIINRFG